MSVAIGASTGWHGADPRDRGGRRGRPDRDRDRGTRPGIAGQAAAAVQGVGVVRAQTDQLGAADELRGVPRINDSGVRILHSARALRKVAVGK